jgi:TonB-dependent SusC/RagA subfamily outer membrane receptor
MDKESYPALVYAPQSLLLKQKIKDTETKDASDFDVFITKAEQRAKYEEDIWTIQLKELEVSAPRIKRNEARLQFWANTSSNQTITRNEIEKIRFSYVADYLSTFAGIHVSPEGEITIFGVGTTGSPRPLILIDGIVQDWPDKALERKTESPLERVSVNMIESIDIFKGPSGVVFGMRGANGAISITTRRGANSPFTEKDNHFIYTPLGYQKPVEFYAPKYETLASRQSPIPDYRTTIFWKPDVVLTDSGEAGFEFYTSDFQTTYSVVIEGLTTDGRIVRQVGKITVSD